jgi:hypothetical protein
MPAAIHRARARLIERRELKARRVTSIRPDPSIREDSRRVIWNVIDLSRPVERLGDGSEPVGACGERRWIKGGRRRGDKHTTIHEIVRRPRPPEGPAEMPSVTNKAPEPIKPFMSAALHLASCWMDEVGHPLDWMTLPEATANSMVSGDANFRAHWRCAYELVKLCEAQSGRDLPDLLRELRLEPVGQKTECPGG